MDLSNTLDNLYNELIIAKLRAYEFDVDESSLKLLHSYLSNRWYRTKLSSKFSPLS